MPRPAGDGGGPLTGFVRTIVQPRWLGLLLVALAVAGVMTAMGVWQLDVYRSKTAEATARRAEQPPVSFQSLVPLDAGLSGRAVGRHVDVTGEWAPAADQLFVSGRQQGGRDGYWVVTPLLLGGGGEAAAVLVVRGWVTGPDDPAAAAPAGPVTVHGTVLASESGGQDDRSDGRVAPSLRIPSLVGLVDYRLYDAFVLLASAEPRATGPEVVPPPAPPTDHAGVRNVAYAVQWWIFAAFTLFMWWRMVRDAHRDRARDPESTVSA